MRTAPNPAGPGFTGRHMLAVMVAFFTVVIAVNLTMAYLANTSWTGIVANDTFTASQQFNRIAEQAKAQNALGWHGALELKPDEVRYRLTGRDGRAVRIDAITVSFRRPVDERDDHTVKLLPAGQGVFAAQHALKDGAWIVEVDAEAGLPHPYRETHRILVRNGIVQ